MEAANPRHAHEWQVFEEVQLPQDKLLVLGVLDTTTNFIEHPELVAQRLVRVAQLVGRERVLAGTDCGFATFGERRPEWEKNRAQKPAERAPGILALQWLDERVRPDGFVIYQPTGGSPA